MIDLEKIGGLNENERVEGDMIYCTKCGEKKLFHLNIPGCEDYLRKACRCEKEAYEKERYEKEMTQEISENMKKSKIPTRYKNVYFSNTELGNNQMFINAYNRCKGYCDNADEVLKHGWGIYLYGDKGTGKTHIVACIVNELLKKRYRVLFTNFFEITKDIKATYNRISTINESDLINEIVEVDFLIIDDIGTESLKKNGEDTWIQEKIYDVLNKRYNERKPTIFTSNNSLKELANERGMLDKSVDRIMEMSTMILKIEGQSFRREMRKVELPF